MPDRDIESIKNEFLQKNSGYSGAVIAVDDTPVRQITSLDLGRAKIKGKFGKLTVTKSKAKPQLKIYERTIYDTSGSLRAIWFNVPRIRQVNETKVYVFLGNVELSGSGVKTLVSPTYSTPTDVGKWSRRLKALLSK